MNGFFIRRPVFSTVLSLIIVLAGLLAVRGLPIEQYPEISPPTVTASASYPGASAETLAKLVAVPIEDQLNGIEGLVYFNSTSSSNGTVSITATFEMGTDVDMAMVEVNNRIKTVEARLPEEVRRNGVTVRKSGSDLLQVLAVESPDQSRDTLFLSNYAKLNLVDEFKRIPGVGDVRVFGARDYSMRVWTDPMKMAAHGVTVAEVISAISQQNAQRAVGRIGDEPSASDQALTFTVTAKGRLITVKEFEQIIIRQDSTRGALRLNDVARIELGAQDYGSATFLNGKPAIGMGISMQSGANALQVAQSVNQKLAEFSERYPSGVDVSIAYDTTIFISTSIKEVLKTLAEAMVLVSLVVFLFLQNWRATLIPLLAVPVSLIGTLAGLWLLDFSINTLTLFAMVLAIGIVVDDAIVVLENVERLMHEKGLDARSAAFEAMREVSGALIAIVLVLCAVFIPVSFLSGITGQLYKQFALTVAMAVTLSGVVALTLTPALCAILLKPQKTQSRFFNRFNLIFDRITGVYSGMVSRTLRRRMVSIAMFGLVLIALANFWNTVPRSFVPAEDQGMLIGSIQLPDGASLSRTSEFSEQYRQIVASQPGIQSVFSVSGFDFVGGGNKSNAGAMFVRLSPWEDREVSAQALAGRLMGMGAQLQDGVALMFNPPAIRGLGSTGGFEFYLQNRGDGSAQTLNEQLQRLIAALKADPQLASVNTFFRAEVPQLFVEVDEARALDFGVSLVDVYQTLQATLSSIYVNDFNRSGKTYRVQLQAQARFRNHADDISALFVNSASGVPVSIAAFTQVSFVSGPEQLERYNGFVAAKINGSAAPGVSSGDAMLAVERIASQTLPAGFHVAWTGQAFQERASTSTTGLAFGFAIIMVFLILAAQYERWTLPMAVILSLPFALLGAFGALMVRDMPNDIYFQIGLVVLVGLAAKNAILIVEFAQHKLDQGLTPAQAAIEAARLRFRPIVMTSLAFILGIVPLVVATGAGAAARQSMGTGVLGGMMASTFIATIFVPLFFVLISKPSPKAAEAAATEGVPQ